MKHLVYIIGIFLLLCVSAILHVRYGNLKHDVERQGDIVQASSCVPTDNRPKRNITAVEPSKYTHPIFESSTEIQQESSRPKDILLVNPDNPLPDDYMPNNLVNLYGQKQKHFQISEADIKIEKTVFEAMETMFTAAQNDGVTGFIITSGYRTPEEQRELYSSTTDKTAAKPGYSEHETGLAFDVSAMGNENFELTPQFEWLSKHCAEYGFILRYPKGMEDITGYPFEPWHYRYVGILDAEAIMNRGITLEQYCNQ